MTRLIAIGSLAILGTSLAFGSATVAQGGKAQGSSAHACCGFAGGRSVVKLTPSVERPVIAVLRAARAMRVAGDTAETWNAFDRVFEPLLDERDKTTDEALAVLLSFYIGEHAH